MEPNVSALARLLGLNTDLRLNCLEGLSDSDATARPLPGTNSVAFIVAHVTDARYFMAQLLGRPLENALQRTLADVSTIDEVTTLPSVPQLSATWMVVAKRVSDGLEAASADVLARQSERPFPTGDSTVLGALAFLVQHESYHFGQIALIRKGRGRGALSYERRPVT